MDPQVALGLGVVALISFIVLIGVWASGKRKKINRAFSGFADRHGLQFEGGRFPVVSGTIDGREITVGNFIQRKASGRATQTAMPMFRILISVMGTLPADLTVNKRSGLLRLVSGVKTGDETLDKAIVLQCSDESELPTYLTEDRKTAIRELIGVGALLESDTCYYEQGGLKPNTDWIDDRYKVMYAAATVLDGI